MKTKSAYCTKCGVKTVHQEFDDKAFSLGRTLAGVALTGLPIFGTRKGKGYACIGCGKVED